MQQAQPIPALREGVIHVLSGAPRIFANNILVSVTRKPSDRRFCSLFAKGMCRQKADGKIGCIWKKKGAET
jgi:hypothetical protein